MTNRDRHTQSHRLADFYGFKTGELFTDGRRNVTVMRIDGADELDWLLTLVRANGSARGERSIGCRGELAGTPSR